MFFIKYLLKKFFVLRVIRGKIQHYLETRSKLFFSNLIVRLPFLKFDQKINLICVECLKDLNDYDVKRFGLGEDKGDLALKILKIMRSNDKLMLLKVAFLISYDRYEHFTLKDLISYLKKSKPNVDDIKSFQNILLSPFAEYGDYERFEKISLWLRKELDKKLNRKIGIYNESSIFTSIGHMTLLVNLLKAIDLKVINKEKTNLKFYITNTPVANIEYSKLLIKKCNEMGVSVERDLNRSFMDHESNLELWPVHCVNKYIFKSHVEGLIEGCWELKYGKKFLAPTKEHIKTASKILLDNYGIVPQEFVGMHLRVTKDQKTLRNTERSTAEYAIKILKNKGLSCFLVGTKSSKNFYFKNSIYNFKDSDHIFDTTKLNLSRYERECLQLFIWTKSRFFLGSLSGGTMPPRAFGTPIIWLDMHPQTHVRLSTRYDHVLLKRIFYEKENRFLNFDELSEEKHIPSQSENYSYVKEKGYRILCCDKEKLLISINEMINYTDQSYINKDLIEAEKKLYFNSLKKILTKGEFIKFEYGAKYY